MAGAHGPPTALRGGFALRARRTDVSATPLAWTHAGFIRLAHAIDAGRPIDTPNVVACRYGTSLCRQ
jgi:hypothetical protein